MKNPEHPTPEEEAEAIRQAAEQGKTIDQIDTGGRESTLLVDLLTGEGLVPPGATIH